MTPAPPQPTPSHSAQDMLARVRRDLGADAGPSDPPPAHVVPLPARTRVDALAWASVTAAARAAGDLVGATVASPDPARIALAFTSERHVRVDDRAVSVWAEMSGFFRTRDGWVRTHANYAHHAEALRRAFGLPATAGRAELADALGELATDVAESAADVAGGLCVAVRAEDPHSDEIRRRAPLVSLRRVTDSPRLPAPPAPVGAPLRGIRVLDLTRVIAGPIATRTLALLGADVLRIDPPFLPETEWVHLDTGHGKRSALLDMRSTSGRGTLERLLASADVVVTGYRARSLERLGWDPPALVARHPGLVVARLTAWGTDESGVDDRAADRRGFDSLVQAASGIAWIESADGDTPGALPAQALDHSAAYLLAAGILTALRRRRTEGGGWIVEVSLRRVAAELLGMPREPVPPEVSAPDPAPHLQRFDLDGMSVTTVGPAVSYPGGPDRFASPRRWGRDAPEWSS